MRYSCESDRETLADRLYRERVQKRKQKERAARERLNAAAPDLLKACIRTKAYLASLPNKYAIESRHLLREVKEAIKKTEGPK